MKDRLAGLLRDWLFIFLFLLSIVCSIAVCLRYSYPLGFTVNVLFPFLISFTMAFIVSGLSDASGAIYTGLNETITEEEAEAKFDLSKALDNARVAERNERFEEAAGHYCEALKLNPADVFARQSLAKIYLHRLERPRDALRQFRLLAEAAPPGSMIRQEAMENGERLLRELREEDVRIQEGP